MMGTKARLFGPIPSVSLEDLVPADHFYRHLDRTLDLTFVRDLVRVCYAEGGRPSIDPVVFFKLQLVMFFEGLRSERQLLRMEVSEVRTRLATGQVIGYPYRDRTIRTGDEWAGYKPEDVGAQDMKRFCGVERDTCVTLVSLYSDCGRSEELDQPRKRQADPLPFWAAAIDFGTRQQRRHSCNLHTSYTWSSSWQAVSGSRWQAQRCTLEVPGWQGSFY